MNSTQNIRGKKQNSRLLRRKKPRNIFSVGAPIYKGFSAGTIRVGQEP